jgi:hypothetical protein
MPTRQAFHLHLPTPVHEAVLIPTALLFLLKLAFGLSWWIVLIPVILDVAVIALAVGAIAVAVRVLNARARRRFRRLMENR